MKERTALILASGKGSRMGQIDGPKHLLPLPNNGTIVTRLAKQLAPFCSQLICTVRDEKYLDRFEEAFKEITPKVELIVKEGEHEYSELSQVAKIVKYPVTVQTNGDLIFEDGVIERFIKKYEDRQVFVRGREGNGANMSSCFDIFNSRISLVPSRILGDFGSADFFVRMRAYSVVVGSMLSGRVEKVRTLFNVDDPVVYQKACEFFGR